MKTISSNCILLLLCVYFFTCSETEAVCDIEKTKRFVKISQGMKTNLFVTLLEPVVAV